VSAEVPHVFTPQTAAKAQEVNENFATLDAISTNNAANIEVLSGSLENVVGAVNDINTSLSDLVTIGSVENALASLQTSLEAGITNNSDNISTLSESLNTLSTSTSENISALSTSLSASINSLSSSVDETIGNLSTSINESLQTLDERLGAVESEVAPHLTLVNGEVTFAVDCSEDASALLTKYQENLHYSNINFILTGDCYGDITNVPNSSNTVQLADQTITLVGSGDTPTIIANPESNKAQLTTGLNGGLYISGVDIISGSNDDYVIRLDRNSHGSVTDSTIEGDVLATGSSVLVFSGATLQGNATINHSTFTAQNAGIALDKTITLFNSNADVSGSSNMLPVEQFICSGLSSLSMTNWSKVDNSDNSVDASTNCVDANVWDAIAEQYLNSLTPST
jgi:hypothetical protein